MTVTIFNETARKCKAPKRPKVYAFGRLDTLAGQSTDAGGYYVFVLSENYCGQTRGGIRKSWCVVDKNLSHYDAVELMNKRLKYKAWNHV
jgi:hypothetical protein